MAYKPADFKTNVHVNWCPGCVLPGTIIHSNPDVKPIERIRVGDRVLGLDGACHRVTEVFSHHHQGKMHRIRAKCLGETTLTPEHPVLIARREHIKLHNKRFDLVWVRADQIHKGDYLAYPIPSEVVDLEEVELPEKLPMDRRSLPLPDNVKISSEFLRLAGYYLAEGWVDQRSANKGKLDATVCLAFNIKERGYVEDIKQIVSNLWGLKVTFKERRGRNLVEVYVHSSRLARAFRKWFGSGAEHKRLPHFMMRLPLEKQQELMQGLWRGDGWVDASKARASYKTISKVLCEQLKMLLLRQGVVPSISVCKASGIHKESYALFVLGKSGFAKLAKVLDFPARSLPSGKSPSSVLDGQFVMVPVASIETFDYDGEVWNLEVEDVQCYVSESAILHNCGDFGILSSVQMALAAMDVAPHRAAIFSGIGCSAKTVHYINAYGIHTLHGRVLPYATGAKLANPNLLVVAVGGDGDGLGIGAGHFVNAGRRNLDITYILFNNGVYGLTKGQASPTLKLGVQTKSLPQPNVNEGVNPLLLALAAGYTFIARGYAFDVPDLVNLIRQGIEHHGSSFIEVLQPCPTYNNLNTKDWYGGTDRLEPGTGKPLPRVYKLAETGYDPELHSGLGEAEVNALLARYLARASEWGERIPIGVFLKNTTTSTYEERITARIAFYRQAPPAEREIADEEGHPTADLSPLLAELRVC